MVVLLRVIYIYMIFPNKIALLVLTFVWLTAVSSAVPARARCVSSCESVVYHIISIFANATRLVPVIFLPIHVVHSFFYRKISLWELSFCVLR